MKLALNGHWPRSAVYIVVATIIVFMMTHCAPANFSKDQKAGNENPYICDPWGGGGGGSHNGLKGDLAYFNQAQVNQGLANQVRNYFGSAGIASPAVMFLNLLNYPTRPFSEGFHLPDGTQITKNTGEPLLEWFALRLKTEIRLNSNNPDGLYQFALLSDDGSILNITGIGDVVNNDGITPTRFAYAAQPIQMNHSTSLPAEILWTQGPRMHIALILMWRQWNGSAYDPAGGMYGNDYWFNSLNTPSTPTANYQGLLNRGWRPLEANNFWLRDDEVNPCN